ncbi:zinc ribbon domain-containing protein [Salarchaeum sp. JOR-1]|uniref:zinc ribbon domain-containing protein n=1 Tax=Salarchaeum sp. JOR-1 TaxID=2599399 RepID=UPI0011982EFC|nr:zinc ribbon domain-containing protein [Salarchaeum sp. JOR-1]QDX39927.1 zinc ribbon domain-containing protein [Salarchaeum sp. JOR-1]
MDDPLTVIGVALVLSGLSALFAGPLGPLVVGLLALAVSVTRGGGDDAVNRVNCPNCGAPNDADADTCEYCDHAISGA